RSRPDPRRFATPPSTLLWARAAAPRIGAVASQRAPLAEPADLARHRAPLLDEELPHRRGQARVAEPVHARGRGRVEAAPELELAARARLEAPEPVRDAVLDARVVADVEVEVAEQMEEHTSEL